MKPSFIKIPNDQSQLLEMAEAYLSELSINNRVTKFQKEGHLEVEIIFENEFIASKFSGQMKKLNIALGRTV